MPTAFLLDLDGTLYTDAGPIPGGPDTVAALRRRGIPFRCVTNTTSRTCAALTERLRGYGYDIAPHEIVTPVRAAAAFCRARGIVRVAAYLPAAAAEDLAGLELAAAGAPAALILGDLGDGWTFQRLQLAFTQAMAGASLIALSKDRYFQSRGGLTLDAGPFVAALEYATRQTATLVGKPSREFFQRAIGSMNLPEGTASGDIVVVGDDLWSDVQGAQQAGCQGWLVRTGKFREETLRDSGVVPGRILESVAELI